MKTRYLAAFLLLAAITLYAQAVRSSIQRSSSVYENGFQLATAPARLNHCFGYNNLATNQFLQVFDKATAPTNGSVPTICIEIEPGKNFSVYQALLPWTFQQGIYICNSTTGPTLTLGASNCLFYTQHDMLP